MPGTDSGIMLAEWIIRTIMIYLYKHFEGVALLRPFWDCSRIKDPSMRFCAQYVAWLQICEASHEKISVTPNPGGLDTLSRH